MIVEWLLFWTHISDFAAEGSGGVQYWDTKNGGTASMRARKANSKTCNLFKIDEKMWTPTKIGRASCRERVSNCV